MQRLTPAALLFGFSALALGACGPSPADKAASSAQMAAAGAMAQADSIKAKMDVSTPNACVVLDEATASQFLGAGTKLRRQNQPNPHMTQCQYAGPKGMITIMVGPWAMIHTGNPSDKAVGGIGDEAYANASGLDVRKGQKGVNIDVETEFGEFSGKAADSLEAKNLAAQTKVAPAIVARL